MYLVLIRESNDLNYIFQVYICTMETPHYWQKIPKYIEYIKFTCNFK